MAFDYEAAKAQYGAGKAREMEQASRMQSAPQQQAPQAPQIAQVPQGPSGGYNAPRQTGAPQAAGGGGNFDYSTPEGIQQFQSWYGQQQGGARPEDMERFKQTDTLKRWDPYLIKEGPDAGKYRSMRGAEGVYDKPQECPPGMVPSGPDETDPCINPGGAGGGGGQGGGGGAAGGGGAGAGQWDNPIYKYLAGTGLQAAQDPEQALKNYMGWGGAQQYQQNVDQARERVMAMPPGPARDAAAARLEEGKLTNLGAMRQAATGQARGELQGLLGHEFNWQGQLPLSYAQLAEQKRQADMQNSLGFAGLGVQERLGMGNLGLGQQQLAWDQNRFGQQLNFDTEGRAWQGGQNQLDRDLQRYGIKENNKGKTTAAILGAVGGILSDIRAKENIQEVGPGLSALSEIPTYTYNYKGDPTPRLGVMAQDVEKVAPILVKERPDGLKEVDSYGLLALTMMAVKELADGSN